MVRSWIVGAVLGGFLSGCGSGAGACGSCRSPTDTTATEVRHYPAEPNGTQRPRHLVGKDRDTIHAQYGSAHHTSQVRPADGLTEMQIEIYNTYPPDDPATRDVVIQEDTWEYDGYAMTLWFHRPAGRWVVLQGIVYTDDVEF